jgi:SAM-dependent methyltransferase
MKCRHCETSLQHGFLDLGFAPPSNAYLNAEDLAKPEKYYPLRLLVCDACWLVQTEDFAAADELFDAGYAYFSSYSSTWLAHAEAYVAEMTRRFALGPQSLVVEVAANDGYLLQYVQARGIPCLGIEPTASTAAAAREKQIDVIGEFFGVPLASRLVGEGRRADLMTANNVLAHVPDINDFVAGFATLLTPAGVATFEFPHLKNLLDKNQFDTIYHEHFSYLSLTAVERIFSANGLVIFDVDEIPTHGGSLRVFAQRRDTGLRALDVGVAEILQQEQAAGLLTTQLYADFMLQPTRIVRELLSFLITAANEGKTVGAYGAAAKGNTLLNFAGVRPHLLPYVVDLNPAKQGKYMPGSQIPIVAEAHLRKSRPDYVLILPWNLREEVVQQLAYIRKWGGQFVTAIPSLMVFA